VTLETGIGQDGADIAVELDRLRRFSRAFGWRRVAEA
jgi:hypothetical protein